MRILFVSHYFAPEVNAPATRTYEHCVRWADEGHDVTVLTCNPNCPTGKVYEGYKNRFWPQVEMIDGVRVVRLWTFLAANAGKRRRSLNYLSFFFAVLFFGLFQRRPDVIVATSPQFFSGLAGVVLGWIRRVPRILEVRDVWPASIEAVGAMRSKPLLYGLVMLEKLMYRLASHIVTVGPGYKKHIEKRTEGRATNISIITNGVDLEKLVPCERDQEFLAANDLQGKFVCSYVGTVGMAHGLDVVIRAAELLKAKERDDIRFCIVGDGARREELEAMARDAGVADYVKFAGLHPKADIPGIFSSSDAVLVHLRGCELFSTVIPSKMFEVMAMERPVIMAVNGVAREIVNDADAGPDMIPDSAEDLATIVQELCDDDELHARYCKNGRSYVEANFNRDTLAREYLSLIHRVAGIAQPETLGSCDSPLPLPPEPHVVNTKSVHSVHSAVS